jgi:hypothetical protein
VSENFRSQVESRLDDLFHEEDATLEVTPASARLGDHPLKGLKAVLLSVEWEINDSSMEALMSELKSLEDFYQKDRIMLTFLRLLSTLAGYIKVRKGQSHPRATGLLSSVYNNLERVALTKEMSRKERERILLDDVEKFKKLKEDILRRKEEAKEKEQASPEAPQQEIVAPEAQEPLPDSAVVPAHEPLAAALAEIKALIREEFRALRAEVKLWRDSR